MDISNFSIIKNTERVLNSCKECVREKDRIRSKERDNSKYMKEYRNRNRNRLNNYKSKWDEENKELRKVKRKEYYEENKDIIKERNYKYCKDRKKSDPIYKLKLNIRSLILLSFKSKFTKKSKKTIEILGCSFEEFSKYLESKFDENMNWSNQGSYWHIDHIIPISLAKSEEEVYKLNHYTNLQPLYWKDNLRKGNKI